jgi:hypothetical protein
VPSTPGHAHNLQRSLARACARAGIAACTPNDLRRTYGTWLRLAGVAPATIGAAMGHADGRMAERVYARLDAAALGERLAIESGHCHTGVTARGAATAFSGESAPAPDATSAGENAGEVRQPRPELHRRMRIESPATLWPLPRQTPLGSRREGARVTPASHPPAAARKGRR